MIRDENNVLNVTDMDLLKLFNSDGVVISELFKQERKNVNVLY